MAGIYIHIPYCRRACHYCDFHFSTQLATMQAMIDAMCEEIPLRKDYLENKSLNSLYFGGGTPSLLGSAGLHKIFSAVKNHFSLRPDAEITLEANPDDVTETSLKTWKEAGINRLSIGLQSFNEEELKWMNRTHSALQSETAVNMAQQQGFDNISIDLIYGSKFQSLESWERTLETAVKLGTQHISAYNLTIEKKTVLGTRFSRGLEPPVNDALSSSQFLMMRKHLQAAGFVHYEISNFGLPGKIAVHNSNYWLGHHYLGIGPSAHSFNGTERHWNVSSNTQYIRAIRQGERFFETEKLSPQDQYNEYVLTRLRTIWGCDLKEIEQRFGKELLNHFIRRLTERKNFVVEKNGIVILNEEGMLQADGIASHLFF